MALLPVRSLWPARGRVPVARLVMALVLAPALITGVVALVAFLIAGMTAPSGPEVWRVTLDTTLALAALVVAFTLTFGLAGIVVLWRAARRGVLAWAVTGLVAGAIYGALFSTFAMEGAGLALVPAFAVVGLALFLLIRWIAGIRAGAPDGEPSPS